MNKPCNKKATHTRPCDQVHKDSFEWECILGKGGFGRVKAACKRDTQEWFAIKIVNKAKILRKKNGVKMLFNELAILSKLEPSVHWITTHWAFTDRCVQFGDLIVSTAGPMHAKPVRAMYSQATCSGENESVPILKTAAAPNPSFRKNCFMVFDLVTGGDLRYHLANLGRTFTEKEARFYTASVIICLEHVRVEC